MPVPAAVRLLPTSVSRVRPGYAQWTVPALGLDLPEVPTGRGVALAVGAGALAAALLADRPRRGLSGLGDGTPGAPMIMMMPSQGGDSGSGTVTIALLLGALGVGGYFLITKLNAKPAAPTVVYQQPAPAPVAPAPYQPSVRPPQPQQQSWESTAISTGVDLVGDIIGAFF